VLGCSPGLPLTVCLLSRELLMLEGQEEEGGREEERLETKEWLG
jgi:hypothetical protein